MHSTVALWAKLRHASLAVVVVAESACSGVWLPDDNDHTPSNTEADPITEIYNYRITDPSGGFVYAEGCAAVSNALCLACQVAVPLPLDTEYRYDLEKLGLVRDEVTSLEQVEEFCGRERDEPDGWFYEDPRCWGGAWSLDDHELLSAEVLAADGSPVPLPEQYKSTVETSPGDFQRFRLISHYPSAVVLKGGEGVCYNGSPTDLVLSLVHVLPVE